MARTSSEALGEPVEGHGASDVACREGGAAGAIGPAGTSVAARIRALPWVCTRARASHVRVLEIFVCVSLSPPTSPVAVWVGQMGVHACMDGSRKHACLHAPMHSLALHLQHADRTGCGSALHCQLQWPHPLHAQLVPTRRSRKAEIVSAARTLAVGASSADPRHILPARCRQSYWFVCAIACIHRCIRMWMWTSTRLVAFIYSFMLKSASYRVFMQAFSIHVCIWFGLLN